jgi:uncharacterized membrane protein (Fun14 family)
LLSVFLVSILPTNERGDYTMTMDIVSVLGPPAAVFFGAGGIGFVFGYAIKKVAKILAVIVGLFFMGLAYMDYNGWVKVNWQAVSNSTNAAVQNGLNQTIAIMNHTAIQVQNHVASSGVNEIGLFPIVGATGLMSGLIYGLQKG